MQMHESIKPVQSHTATGRPPGLTQESSMARFLNLMPASRYDVTGPDGQFVVRNLTGAAIMAPAGAYTKDGQSITTDDHWQPGSCAWLTECPDGADDTDPADVAA